MKYAHDMTKGVFEFFMIVFLFIVADLGCNNGEALLTFMKIMRGEP